MSARGGVIRTEYARCEPFRFWTPHSEPRSAGNSAGQQLLPLFSRHQPAGRSVIHPVAEVGDEVAIRSTVNALCRNGLQAELGSVVRVPVTCC
jgi:hypothetical protein